MFDRSNQDPSLRPDLDTRSSPIDPDIKMEWQPVSREIVFSGFFECSACDLPFRWGAMTIYHSLFGHVNTYYFTIQKPSVTTVGFKNQPLQQKWEVRVDVNHKDSNNVSFSCTKTRLTDH